MNNSKCNGDVIKADAQNETIEGTVCDLRTQISLLERQNAEIRLKLDEEVF